MNYRKHSHISGTIPRIVKVYLFLWGFLLPAWAGDSAQAEPLALRKIMQELGHNMQAITGAISQEEWGLVAKLAPKVAEHPEPPLTEKIRILAYLGTDATKFKNFDAQTHEAAQAMKLAAASSEGKAVLQSFAHVQESCLGCHQAFRKPFVEHFYGAR
uniref:cytochrome C n=1 Tax=Shewanella glacialipiscicola TaxID=614069 RepID=UPI0037DA779A